MKEITRLHREAKSIAGELAKCVPWERGTGRDGIRCSDPIEIGYRDRYSDEWVVLATVSIIENRVYVDNAVVTPANRADVVKRAKERIACAA
jgi:hypothetical protein